MQTWILSAGEEHHGGDVLGVYLDKDQALLDFAVAARDLGEEVSASEGPNGIVRASDGYDWVALEPHEARNKAKHPAG